MSLNDGLHKSLSLNSPIDAPNLKLHTRKGEVESSNVPLNLSLIPKFPFVKGESQVRHCSVDESYSADEGIAHNLSCDSDPGDEDERMSGDGTEPSGTETNEAFNSYDNLTNSDAVYNVSFSDSQQTKKHPVVPCMRTVRQSDELSTGLDNSEIISERLNSVLNSVTISLDTLPKPGCSSDERKGKPLHICHVCQKGFRRKPDLNKHILIHTGFKPFTCEVCNKEFRQKSTLNAHYLLHTGLKLQACDQCDKRFYYRSNLKRHYLIHLGVKSYACDICNKRFIRKNEVDDHRRTHTGEKPHKCDVCEKCFGRKRDLQLHYRIHTKEKPHKCGKCGRCFSRKGYLRAHYFTHTEVKAFICDICNRGFNRKDCLLKHYRNHTGDKSHVCEICQKSFSRKYELKEHRLVHTDEKAHVCNICGTGFKRKAELKRHDIIHTGGVAK